MFYLLLILVVAFLVWRQRSEGVIVVRTLPPRPRMGELARQFIEEFEESAASSTSGGAKLPVNVKNAAIRDLVSRNEFIEAMQLYRRLHNVDMATAKAAIDKMMLEQ